LNKFSDFAINENIIDGSKTKIENILNKEILVLAYKIKDSKFNKTNSDKCLTMQLELNQEKYIIFTGSSVLIDQIEKYKDKLPFVSTIIKVDKYFTFS